MATGTSETQTFHPNVALYFALAIMIVMMACLAHVLIQVLAWFFPQIDFSYLLPFGIFVSLEMLVSTSLLYWEDDFSPRRLSYRAVEGIILIVLAKALSYLSIGFDQLAADLLVWDDQFSAFFTLEFIAGACFAALIWLMTSHLTTRLMDLFSSREILDLELEGIRIVDRSGLRRKLGGLIFTSGSLMLAVVSLIEISPNLLPDAFRPVKAEFVPVVIYFVCGLILLSQTQLFNLWSRWYLNRIQASPGIWGRWIGLSLLLIACSALVASLLPTGYSLGLMRSLQTAFGYLLYLLAFLQFIISAPFFLLINFLANLFGGSPAGIHPQAAPPSAPMAPPGETFSDPLWVELLRSIFFWTVFFSVIFFAFRYYFHQSEEVVETLRKQPYLYWLFKLLSWLKSFFSRSKGVTQAWFAFNRRRIKKAHDGMAPLPPVVMPAIEKLPPRQRIRLIYLLMVEWLNPRGYPRQKFQTPTEYAQQLTEVFPASAQEIRELTNLFILARYSQALVTPAQAKTARRCWNALRKNVASSLNGN